MVHHASFEADWLQYEREDLRLLLGPWAPWLIDPEGAPIDGLTDPGVAVILVENDTRKARGLPGASLVPARWVRAEVQPPGLPSALVAQSEAVLSALGKEYAGWRLAPLNADLAAVDLREFPMDGTSCFATLTAALMIAVGRGRTLPRVFASIGWSGDHLQAVDERGLPKKVALVNAFAPATLFVHPDNHETAVASASAGVTVVPIELPSPGKQITAIRNRSRLTRMRSGAPDDGLAAGA